MRMLSITGRPKKDAKFTSVVGAIAHTMKGALGGAILSGYVSYMKFSKFHAKSVWWFLCERVTNISILYIQQFVVVA